MEPLSDKLSPEHLAMLREGSGISDSVIAARGYRTITDGLELRSMGFTGAQCLTPGLLLPVWSPDGSNGLQVYRPDNPRVKENRRKRNPDGSFKTDVIKYELPAGAGIRLDCPPACRPSLANPSIRLWITEGQKKADALASRGLCSIALLGVWNFKGKNVFGATAFLADWDYIALDERKVCIVFDSDVMLKLEVRKALDRLTEHLKRKGALVTAIYLPAENEQKIGVDDYLLTHTVTDLVGLIDAPRPQPQPAPPQVELLDCAPSVIRKPLTLINGRAYAAIWPYVQVTQTEALDKDGNIIRFDEPKIHSEQRLLIFRDDGMTFGDGGFEPMKTLGMEVNLPEIPPNDRLWSSPAIKAFRNKERPIPSDVFSRIGDVVSRFIDFDHSLADQKTMSELVACYIMATWFLDAFNVIGFLWPTGERGSGKTQLLTLVAELSYLGQMILAGGSYASLRDLADYGATLCFDDAENLSDPKKTDPDKRALFLAGNRRGNTVTIKEAGPDKKWRTRHVHTFCARCFSAIRLPDPVLASRTIIIPLVRTPDRQRANADPLDYHLWPHDRRKLIDDLWAIGLIHLAEIPGYEMTVNSRAKLTGRNLEPWRPLLVVARWLEDKGVEGLYERMEKLSVGYQSEKQEMEATDLTALVIRAVCKCLVPECDVLTFCDVLSFFTDTQKTFLKTSEITETAREIAQDEELPIDLDHITERRIGWILKKLRVDKWREPGTGKRGWSISKFEMQRFLKAFGLYTSEKTSQNDKTSQTADADSDEVKPSGETDEASGEDERERFEL